MRELCQLAWEGVESNKTLFHEKDISPDVLQVLDRTGIISKVRQTCTMCGYSLTACRAAWGGVTGRLNDIGNSKQTNKQKQKQSNI